MPAPKLVVRYEPGTCDYCGKPTEGYIVSLAPGFTHYPDCTQKLIEERLRA